MKEVIKNTTPAFADVAVFDYYGVPHFAFVESMGMGFFAISETNYRRCTFTTRKISFDDPRLVGFYNSKLLP